MLVVKISGSDDVDAAPLLDDLADRTDPGEPWVLVHGASDRATRLGEALDRPPEWVTSVSGHTSRFTDEETRDVLSMASALENQRLVAGLRRRGVDALGLRGLDGGLLRGPRKDVIKVRTDDGRRRVLRGDHTGRVDEVRTGLLEDLLDRGFRPVLGLPVLADDGEPVNADADRVAAAVAAALEADALVLLTDAPGLLRDPDDPDTLVGRVGPGGWEQARAHAQGPFRTKLLAAREALEAGVPRVQVAGADRPHPLEAALAGAGTRLEAPAPGVQA